MENEIPNTCEVFVAYGGSLDRLDGREAPSIDPLRSVLDSR